MRGSLVQYAKAALGSDATATKQLLQQIYHVDTVNAGHSRGRKKRSSNHNTATDHKHKDVISKSLCDETLQYIAPTLEAYKGTTIIDVNPGACVWSRSLHEYLKPKRHVLLEPDDRYFKPFIEPLLEQNGSKYIHLPLAGARETGYFDNWTKILQGTGDLPPRPSLPAGDPRLQKLDTSLLITGNLWRLSTKSRMTQKLAPMVITQTAWAAHSNLLFHNAGRVRMLWWLPEAEVRTLLSQDYLSRTALSTGLELTSDVNFVVGCNPLHELNKSRGVTHQRGPHIDRAVAAQVQDRMAQYGFEAPRERMLSPSLLKELPATALPTTNATTCSTIAELNDLLTQFDRRRNQAMEIVAALRKEKASRPKDQSLEYWMANLRRQAEEQVVYPQSVKQLFDRPPIHRYLARRGFMMQAVLSVDLLLQVYRMEAEWQHLSKQLHDQTEELNTIKERIMLAGEQWYHYPESPVRAIDRLGMSMHAQHLKLADAEPKPIHHDNRLFEPIKALKQEFWPEGEMALLDITPREINLGAEGIIEGEEAAAACRELMKHFFLDKGITLAGSLERLAPNARVDLLPELPELADTQQGGRLDPSTIPVRSVHRDTFLKLIHAFWEWPFRPETSHLALQVEDIETLAKGTAADAETAAGGEPASDADTASDTETASEADAVVEELEEEPALAPDGRV